MASQLRQVVPRLARSHPPSTSTRLISTSSTLLAPPTSSSDKVHRQLSFVKKSGQSIFKTFLPVTPSLRQRRAPVSSHLHKGSPLRALTIAKRSSGGRNDQGRITVRARGGGHKRRIRLVDFVRKESGEQDVVRIEYDPGRSAHIALIRHRETGGMSYILAPGTLREGDVVQSFREGLPDSFTSSSSSSSSSSAFLSSSSTNPSLPQTVLPPSLTTPSQTSTSSTKPSQIDLGVLRSLAILPGNCLPLRLIPVGTQIYGISLSPSGPAILARSAGSSARIISMSSSTNKHAQIRLSSGEVRLVGLECVASVGVVSNQDHQHENLGKAGRMRWLGFRPQSRGVAMNAKDHPHGGGRGKSKGNKAPTDPWGNSADGGRTRSPKSKSGNKMVVKERPRGTDRSK